MSAKGRDGGNRQKRTRGGRPKELGNYYIVTDARETEKNYFEGLRASFPANLQDKIEIKVCDISSYKGLIPEALKGRQDAQFRQLWLVFDRDQIPNFDEILDKAQADAVVIEDIGFQNDGALCLGYGIEHGGIGDVAADGGKGRGQFLSSSNLVRFSNGTSAP